MKRKSICESGNFPCAFDARRSDDRTDMKNGLTPFGFRSKAAHERRLCPLFYLASPVIQRKAASIHIAHSGRIIRGDVAVKLRASESP